MQTRDRILHTSLELFNIEGEADTTTIDIANELDISPGNLYYHFKGKDQIIAQLFSQYEHAMANTLAAPGTRVTTAVQDQVTGLDHIVSRCGGRRGGFHAPEEGGYAR